MSNTTTAPSGYSPDVLRALVILPAIEKYILSVIYTAGILGSILNIITLLQKQFRKNPCSLYFLSASVTDFLVMNAVVMMDALRYYNPPLFRILSLSAIWCKLGTYFIVLLSCLSSTFIILASMDRFCTSSRNPQLRKLSRIKVSRILISFVSVAWILFSIHVIILYDILPPIPSTSDRCRSAPEAFTLILILDGYFFSLFNGAIVSLCLSIFGFLTYRNVQLSRQRLAPTSHVNSNRSTVVVTRNPYITRQNLHLIIMVLAQSSLTVFLNIPYTVIHLNGYYNTLPTNQELLLVYIISVYVARWFWFSNYMKTFYLNSLSSEVYRNALKQQLFSLCQQHRGRILPWTSS